MGHPLFSVIIPVYNAEGTIETAIKSVQNQVLADWEALIINDASSDFSAELASELAAQDPRLCLLENPDQANPLGAAAARNMGIENARGRYVAFLDADDTWLPQKLAYQHEAFLGGADIVFSSYRRIDAAEHSRGVIPARPRVTWQDALAGNPIGCLTGAYRRAAFPDARMPLDVWPEDYGFWLDLLRDGAVAIGLPEVLAEYRVTAGSVSSNKLASAYGVWQLLGRENISLSQRVYGFSSYLSSSARRRFLRFPQSQ